jgi:lipopolysaccharide biosynthesis protein
MKIAVCVHLFYPDMFEQIIKYLDNLTVPYKLYVNICPGKYNKKQIDFIYRYKSDTVINISRNRGVDVGGFLSTLKVIDNDTDLIIKIHTKKGIGSETTPSNSVKRNGVKVAERQANKWFHNMMKGVLKDVETVNRIINEFRTNEKCGMVGFKLYNGLGPNKNEIIKISELINLDKNLIGGNFIGGTIFWVRYSILKKYLTTKSITSILNSMSDGYVVEPSPQHAMERIFGYMVQGDNKKIMTIN